ncbi:uncharacterized protein FIBRA_07813 [Fibroporia radiculosa]|uniref:VPS10 domain-containing protein n=1 Tax=Fibroporia radiculosa TaxID=599839 RepID=J4GVN1_9APHY|nr:uncharacterized protein FIBRA_07813 [Fibroporia radiculosa]CCM05585.1 predicted protein [Fibroporia radiculosa]
MSRDGGFTWEEVQKDAHLWEFGDSGSILIMANDEEPTDHILFSTDEGRNWREYIFGDEKMRVKEIVTVPSDTSRRFILMGYYPRSPVVHAAVHIDFSSLITKKCILDLNHPEDDDFELWSPNELRNELCLFGRQVLYHRRKRDANCVVGKLLESKENFVKNCACEDVDFECEYNYKRNASGECVPVPGTQPLASDDTCITGDYWYERTAYRKIHHSSCEGGIRLDRGLEHPCPGYKNHGAFFWFIFLVIPFAFAGLVGWYYYRKNGFARGTIRLPGGDAGRNYNYYSDSSLSATIVSIPWYLMGLASMVWEAVSSRLGSATGGMRGRNGYRTVPVDEDAQILRFEDDD